MEELKKKIPIAYYTGDLGFFKHILSALYFLDVRVIAWQDVIEKCRNSIIDVLIVDENFFYKDRHDPTRKYKIHFDQLVELLNQNRIGSLLIYNHHVMQVEKERLQKIDEIAKNMKISLMACGEYDFDLKNIKVKNQDIFEIMLHNPYVKALSMMLSRRRKPEKDFMLSVVVKDEFRKKVVDELLDTDVSIISGSRSKSEILFKKIDDVAKVFLKKLHDFELKDYNYDYAVDTIIKVFANGPPNFDLYEKYLCELVIETSNTGPWHLTEKTYRPIAFGIPIIFLGHKPMFDHLIKYGYQLHDDNFYVHWHSDISLEQKIVHLKSFLQSLKNDDSRKKLVDTASHNYGLFWNNRRFNHMDIQYDFFYDFFGEDVILKEAYNLFNF